MQTHRRQVVRSRLRIFNYCYWGHCIRAFVPTDWVASAASELTSVSRWAEEVQAPGVLAGCFWLLQFFVIEARLCLHFYFSCILKLLGICFDIWSLFSRFSSSRFYCLIDPRNTKLCPYFLLLCVCSSLQYAPPRGSWSFCYTLACRVYGSVSLLILLKILHIYC